MRLFNKFRIKKEIVRICLRVSHYPQRRLSQSCFQGPSCHFSIKDLQLKIVKHIEIDSFLNKALNRDTDRQLEMQNES